MDEEVPSKDAGLYVRSTTKVLYGRENLRKKEKPGKKIVDERSFDIPDDDDDESDSQGVNKMARIMFNDSQNLPAFERQKHSEIEKRRRDKMNAYIVELSTMLPMCNAMDRKLDKLTVLRMAVQHLKSLRGAATTFTAASHRPQFLSDDEIKKLILKAAEGFLFVVSCDRARLLYVSESVKNVLNYTRNELIGQSLFDYLHPRDISKVKEQLSSSDLSPRERLIDARTMMPVKAEFPTRPTPTYLCSGARRSFFCQMKCSNKGTLDMNFKGKKDDIDFCYRKKKTDRKSYILIHCTGYLKSWPTSNIDLNEQEDSDENCNLSCLVAVCQVKSSFDQLQISTNCDKINVRPVEYMSRHSTDGKFTYIDQGATILLGYLPQELLGTSVYEYYHQDDIQEMVDVHKKVLQSKEKVKSCVYRFKSKDGSFIHLRSVFFSFVNPWTKEVEYIVSTNTIVQWTGCFDRVQEVSSSGQEISTVNNLPLDTDDSTGEESEDLPQSQPSRKHKFKIPSVTQVGAGRIGRQVAQEVMENQKEQDTSGMADSTNPMCTPSPTQLRNGHQPSLPIITASASHPHTQSTSSDSSNLSTASPTPRNGISVHHNAVPSTSGRFTTQETNLLENVITEQQVIEDVMSGNDGNDEAAMSIIMSLLEADAGLGGPIDFIDLPWTL